jgi:hypothetical protein
MNLKFIYSELKLHMTRNIGSSVMWAREKARNWKGLEADVDKPVLSSVVDL